MERDSPDCAQGVGMTVRQLLSSPSTYEVTTPLPAGRPALVTTARLPADPEAAGRLLDHLVTVTLTPAERRCWDGLPSAPRRRRQWLLGRVAAKDAVRTLVHRGSGADLQPSDIEILAGRYGRPDATVRGPGALAQPVLVSIAHSGEHAVATACEATYASGIGIDIERCRERKGVQRKGLTASERDRLDRVPKSLRTETMLRWWCAKEAAVKALGAGLHRSGGAQRIEVTVLRPDSGRLRVDVAPGPGRAARSLYAVTRRDGDVILATVVDARRGWADHEPQALRLG